MSILKLKYKAHRLINIIFYIIIFLLGVFIGYGSKSLKIKDILPNILMIDNVQAYNITSTINENYIVEKFSTNSDFDISIYNNIFCLYNSSSTAYQYCYALSDEALANTSFSYSTSGYIEISLSSDYTYNVNPTPGFRLELDDNTVSNLNTWSYGFSHEQKYSSFKDSWYFSFIPNGFDSSSWFGERQLLDFSGYISTTYIKIDYLDSDFNILSSTNCIDLSEKECSLDINSNEGSYIKTTYYVDKIIGQYGDFLNNNTYQLKTKIKGVTDDTSLSYFNYWYYFNDSTDNVDSELVYPTSKTKYLDNDTYIYNTTFKNVTDYDNVGVYEFSVFYKTNGSSYTTISIPYTFIYGVLGADLDEVESSQLNNQQTIIDQNQSNIDNSNKTNEKLDDINSSLNDSNVDGASGSANDFFSNFENNDYGLSDIITIPLETISKISSGTCSPINAKLPYIDKTITLPCLNDVYEEKFPTFLLFYNIIMYGFISYWVVVQVYAMVKGFKDPDNDKIEVVDL